MERRRVARWYGRGLRRVGGGVGERVRGAGTAAILLGLALGVAGCRHKAKPVAVPQAARAPVDLETPPPAASPPMIAKVPPPQLAPLPPPAAKPARKKKAAAAAKEPVQVASAETPAAAIGALSNGSDATAQSQQQAKELIAAIGRRIAALAAKTADAQRAQLRQVKQFLVQAQRALDSGDGEGANTLATKAKLLMDDVEKK